MNAKKTGLGIISLTNGYLNVKINIRMRRNLVLVLVIATLLLIAGVTWYLTRDKKDPAAVTGITSEGQMKTDNWLPPPENIKVPEKGEAVPAGVAAPDEVIKTGAGVPDFREYNIEVKGDKFVPDTVIVRKGDNFTIKFTAMDKSYDFTQPDYGIKKELPMGKTTNIGWQATDVGDFRFYCSSCGGPDNGPVGHLIISP